VVHPRLAILSAIVAFFITASITVTPQAGAQETTLRVWDQFTGPESEAIEQIYAAFMEQNPEVTIEREVITDQQMRQTANVALGSGTGPDIVYYAPGPAYAGVLADAELIMPLDDMAAKFGWDERVATAALDQARINGVLYGLPLEIDLIGMYANRTLLDQEGWEIPETIPELISFCQTASDAGYIPMAFSNNPGWSAFHQFTYVSNNMIGPEAMEALLFDHEGRWDTPEQIQAIDDFFVKLRDAHCFADDVNALGYDDGNSLFFSGQALLNSTGSWLMSDIEENMPDYEVEYVPFPAVDGGQGRYWNSGLGSNWVVSSKSENQELAGEFLDFMISPESAKIWAEVGNTALPVTLETDGLEVSPLFLTVLDVLNSAAVGESELGYNIDVLVPSAFNEVMQSGFQAVLNGDKTPEEQAADLQAAWEASIADSAGS
jgi:raffinose/stachyose/melibiose transport system substrate-binding protein